MLAAISLQAIGKVPSLERRRPLGSSRNLSFATGGLRKRQLNSLSLSEGFLMSSKRFVRLVFILSHLQHTNYSAFNVCTNCQKKSRENNSFHAAMSRIIHLRKFRIVFSSSVIQIT